MEILLAAAIIPVVLLCFYIYKKDQHKEPKGLLASLLALGALICIPVVIGEIIVGEIFSIEESESFIEIFINVFFAVAIVEEGFKWIVTYFRGYKNREFDEVYDIIVYSVFASLGFACIENIMYVFSYGLGTAVMRALTSVPGHASFGVLMGYYMSKAKVNEINGQKSLKNKNLLLSLLIPTIFHTLFDAILSWDNDSFMLIFFIFDIAMVVYCFLIVKKMSKIQQNLSTNIDKGIITESKEGTINYAPKSEREIKFCPICGRSAEGNNFCPQCGFKFK